VKTHVHFLTMLPAMRTSDKRTDRNFCAQRNMNLFNNEEGVPFEKIMWFCFCLYTLTYWYNVYYVSYTVPAIFLPGMWWMIISLCNFVYQRSICRAITRYNDPLTQNQVNIVSNPLCVYIVYTILSKWRGRDGVVCDSMVTLQVGTVWSYTFSSWSELHAVIILNCQCVQHCEFRVFVVLLALFQNFSNWTWYIYNK
jgi:hypothetical protein